MCVQKKCFLFVGIVALVGLLPLQAWGNPVEAKVIARIEADATGLTSNWRVNVYVKASDVTNNPTTSLICQNRSTKEYRFYAIYNQTHMVSLILAAYLNKKPVTLTLYTSGRPCLLTNLVLK